MRQIAVIDMGSNSFRLVVYGYEADGPWMLTDEIREAVRVGAGMGEERRLQPERVELAVRTAEVFAAFCHASGIEDVAPVGTSAIRDASNSAELLDAVTERTGWHVRVLSAEEEARYAHIAMVNSTTLQDGWGVDLGGGSMQVMRVEDRRMAASASWPLGAVRVSEDFLAGEETSGKQIKALRRHVREQLSGLDLLPGDGGRLVGVGGSLRNLAAAAQKQAGWPSELGTQGFVLGADALDALVEELAARPVAKRGSVPGIKPDRGDVILGAALVFATLLEVGGFEGIEVTDEGLREGIFFERFLAPREPLLDDVRRQSVKNLSRRFHYEPAHVRHVSSLSRELYDGLAEAGVIEASDEDRDLLWAASMLHDIGVAIAYDDHHKHSRYLILNAGLPGWTPREVALIALIARYHRKGEPDIGELGPLARKGDGERLALLSGVIRVAEQLERSRDQSIDAVRVRPDGDGDAVRIEAHSVRDGDVAIWSAERNDDLLARATGRPLRLVRAG